MGALWESLGSTKDVRGANFEGNPGLILTISFFNFFDFWNAPKGVLGAWSGAKESHREVPREPINFFLGPKAGGGGVRGSPGGIKGDPGAPHPPGPRNLLYIVGGNPEPGRRILGGLRKSLRHCSQSESGGETGGMREAGGDG